MVGVLSVEERAKIKKGFCYWIAKMVEKERVPRCKNKQNM